MSKFGIFLIFLSFCIVIGVSLYIINPFKEIQNKNDEKRIKDLKLISLALEKYFGDYGHYPHYDQVNYIIADRDDIYAWGTPWMPYFAFLPKDTGISRRYVYWSDKDNNFQSYRLYASLENPSAWKEACSVIGECKGVPAPFLCGADKPCNFGITSNNISP
jgi:hypothetical protein